MRKPFILVLWFLLLFFVLASIYISFTAYLYERDAKVLANVTTFLTSVEKGIEKINVPYPRYSILMYRKEPSGQFTSTNILSPEEKEKYIQMQIKIEGGTLLLYVRKVDIGDYIRFITNNALYTGLIIVSLLLYVLIFYFIIKEFEAIQGSALNQELVNKLKALRLTMATFKVIPEESIDEMKKLVDSILKNKPTKG